MRRMICTFVVCIWHKTHFRMTWPKLKFHLTCLKSVLFFITIMFDTDAFKRPSYMYQKRKRQTTWKTKKAAFGVLPMVPLVILPLVPRLPFVPLTTTETWTVSASNGTTDNYRNLNSISIQWYHWQLQKPEQYQHPMVPLVKITISEWLTRQLTHYYIQNLCLCH